MRFVSPEWFLLLPILLIGIFWWKNAGLRAPLRLICLVLLVVLLAQPEVRRLEPGLDLWVLIDQSASAEERLLPRLPEWEMLIERSMSPEDRVFYVDFAGETIMRGDDETLTFTGNRGLTRLAGAIRFTLARMNSNRANRILVLSDGYSTEPLGELELRMMEQQVPLDYRLVGDRGEADYRIESLVLPERAQAGEPFLIEITVSGRPDATVPFTLYRDEQRIGGGDIEIRQGRGRTRLAERLSRGGSHQYEARIHPEEDAHPGNNVTKNWIEIAGGPRILLVTSYTGDPLIQILQDQGFEVDVEIATSNLTPGRLSGARAVILNNVSASSLPPDFISAIDFFVRAQGGGLLMAGGRQSFGAGGYHGSAIEDLLPVSTELRQEHRRLTAAMAIVMDRSGSMNAQVQGGRSKMDLANAGAAQTIDMLGDGDAVTVFAVDTQPHMILPLTVLEQNREPLTGAVLRITSAGGGIYVYTGLRAAWEQLQRATQGQRHLILFADARDAEEPGNYEALIAEMVAEGVTISVIGLGSEYDVDAGFLRDIAARGDGRVFFNTDASELPAIFAQETVAVARSTFVDEPTPVRGTAGWLEIAARQQEWPAAIDGYNLNYLKPEATAGAFTADEHEAPLIAFWHRGIGRAAAVSFPFGGGSSERVRNWNGYSDFIQTISRWLAGDDTPPGLGLKTRIEGETLSVELLYDDEWESAVSRQAPRLLLSKGTSREIETAIWERMEPGHYRARIPLEPNLAVRGAAQVGNQGMPFGPMILGRSPEWDFEPARVEELRHLARMSGGGERLDLPGVWQSTRQPAFRDLRLPLLVLLLILILMEAAWTRLGGRFRIRRAETATAVARNIRVPKKKKLAFPKRKKAKETEKEEPEEVPAALVPEGTDQLRQDRFARAKLRGRLPPPT